MVNGCWLNGALGYGQNIGYYNYIAETTNVQIRFFLYPWQCLLVTVHIVFFCGGHPHVTPLVFLLKLR